MLKGEGLERRNKGPEEECQVESKAEIRIKYSLHSVKKMSERNIPPKLVEEALKFPDYVFDSRLGPRIIVYKKMRYDLYLRVIYEGEKNNPFIITLHWARRIAPEKI